MSASPAGGSWTHDHCLISALAVRGEKAFWFQRVPRLDHLLVDMDVIELMARREGFSADELVWRVRPLPWAVNDDGEPF